MYMYMYVSYNISQYNLRKLNFIVPLRLKHITVCQ